MRTINGNARRIGREVVGQVTKNRLPFLARSGKILVVHKPKITDFGYNGFIQNDRDRPGLWQHRNITVSHDSFSQISDGDVIRLSDNGDIYFLWENNSKINTIFVTESCNCHCVMCPQPPKKHNTKLLSINKFILNHVDQLYEGDVGFTGGEPTLIGDDFIELLSICRHRLPNASISVLTNARKFSEFEFARKFALLGLGKLLICISLQADVDTINDNIVRSKGSFIETQKGIYNLAKFQLPIEIRVVVNRMNYRRIPQIADYIYRNYPFASHVAFMALEMTGLAQKNASKVWVDPYEYSDLLEEGVHDLHRRGMHVSIYNHQLCILKEGSHKYARQSISAWKNSYLPICGPCILKESCCGVFTTSGSIVSDHLNPKLN